MLFTYESMNKRREGHQNKSTSTFCCLAASEARAACLLPVCILPGGTSGQEPLNLLLPCNIRGKSCLPASCLHSAWWDILGESNSTFCCLATSGARAACLLPVCILSGRTSGQEQLNLLLPCNIRDKSGFPELPASCLHSA